MEWTSEGHLLLLSAQSRLNYKLRAGCSTSSCPDEFWVFSDRNLIASLGTMCLAVKRCFLRTTLNFQCSACASQLLWTPVNLWEVSDIIFPVTTHNPLGQVEKISNFPWAFSHFLRNTIIKGTLLAYIHLPIHQDTQALFCKTAFYPVTSQLWCCIELLHSRWGLIICLCWTSQMFPTANFSSLSRTFWMVSLPFSTSAADV